MAERTAGHVRHCQHLDFDAHVSVQRLYHSEGDGPPNPPDAFAADITVKCAVCGASFGFRVPDVGLLPDRPAVSPDALELRVPLIAPAELQLVGPLAAMRSGGGYPGVRIRVRGPRI